MRTFRKIIWPLEVDCSCAARRYAPWGLNATDPEGPVAVPSGAIGSGASVDPDLVIVGDQLDWELLRICKDALEHQKRAHRSLPISNRNRTVGTLLSYFVTKKYGEHGLREDTIDLQFTGSAGQSFGAFVTRGITLRVRGDANDYAGKGLSGGKLIIAPPPQAAFPAGENVIVGNVALYGATGGVVVVLGGTGRNFAAGMSGGYAFVYDPAGRFRDRCNLEMVDLVPVEDYKDVGLLSNLINRHVLYTGSEIGNEIVNDYPNALGAFIKIFPRDYRRVQEQSKVVQRQWELING